MTEETKPTVPEGRKFGLNLNEVSAIETLRKRIEREPEIAAYLMERLFTDTKAMETHALQMMKQYGQHMNRQLQLVQAAVAFTKTFIEKKDQAQEASDGQAAHA